LNASEVGNVGVTRGVHRRALAGGNSQVEVMANMPVWEEAAFDGPYNLAMEPAPRRAALAPRLPLGVS